MKVSVVIGAYRGTRWIGEQLASVLAQSRPADEILVRDDASGDDTPTVARQGLLAAGERASVLEGQVNLGVTANFAELIKQAQGDIIVLADQDDIWRPDKLARIEQAFLTHPEAALVFSDALLVDEKGQSLGVSLWQRLGITRREHQAIQSGRLFEVLLRRNVVTGATMAFRSSYRDLLLPIPEGWLHDGWIALLLSAVAPYVEIPEPLIEYRQHGSQQVGERYRGWYGQYLIARQMQRGRFQQTAELFAEARARLVDVMPSSVPPGRLDGLAGKVAHWDAREALRETRWRLPGILREVCAGHYHHYSRGWKAIAQDLFL